MKTDLDHLQHALDELADLIIRMQYIVVDLASDSKKLASIKPEQAKPLPSNVRLISTARGGPHDIA
jgi:hypothetical protein